MDSDSVASITPSDALSSTKARTAAGTWAHAREAQGLEPPFNGRNRILYCIHCPEEKPYSSSVTTNIRKHLNAKHQITAGKDDNQILHQSNTTTLDQDTISETLTSLIIRRNLPFRIVEWPEFHAFCQAIGPGSKPYLVTVHSTIPTLMDKMWYEKKDIVRRAVQSALSSIHISLDIWTSPNRYLFLAVCAHYVSREEKLCKALLALRSVGNHSGEEQFAVNAFLFRDSKDLESLEQEEKDNNALESLGPLGKLHNIVLFIRGSASRTQEFKKLSGRLIPFDNRTRWNNWYLILEVALKKATEIDTYTKANFCILGKDFLSPEDWAWLQSVKIFLEPFYRATLETQGDNATIDKVFFTMDILIQCLDDSLKEHSTDREFCRRIRNAWDIFDKYYSKTEDEYADYSNREPYEIKTSALEWWCQDTQKKRWPRLSCMAMEILSIPAMSAEPERVFSGARRTVSWEKASLGAETIEKTECLKHWTRSGLVDTGV